MPAIDGQFVWFDLMTPNRRDAKSFYGEVVGWKTSSWARTMSSGPQARSRLPG